MEALLERPVKAARYVGRLAPSPTGALHLGNVRTFMIAYLRARSQGGRLIMRMEDLDHPRDKPGAAAAAVAELRFLGFEWDEEYVQSERRAYYREALASLRAAQLAYPCICSRRDVESAQSAPHAGEQLHYPGCCRGRFATWAAARAAKGAQPVWRFRVETPSAVEFEDAFAGRCRSEVAATLGDFPLARDEDGAGYTLAVAVDDYLMGVTEVVRGDDLIAATPAQILVRRALYPHSSALGFCHVPLAVGPDGKRLAKRHGDTRIAAYRAAGVRPGAILGRLAHSCGWCEAGEEVTLAELLPRFSLASIPRSPWVVGAWPTPWR